MPWIENEDAAIKAKLQGIFVNDTNTPAGGLPVDVRFRLPENELATATFPLILIERTRAEPDHQAEHRGTVVLGYTPEGQDSASTYLATDPIPYLIEYQVTVYARKQRHAANIAHALSGRDYLHPRWAYLEVPEDGTVRRLEVAGGPEFHDGRDAQGKRLWQVDYLIQVSAELLDEIAAIKPVQTVELNTHPLGH
ncbi:hypothetical protein [Streptomyces sp. CB03238]|uniref:hypothetical protein n=1 Tax=Streptomyces sp. CB03238 TaxID=1907777 RepID=UPI000A12251B|nr:hypothetical protein [Streptomyces sp. CB03238]ORT58168.1 hypothetical protein BKD26_19900 [Streptomyces sp. CB03238]